MYITHEKVPVNEGNGKCCSLHKNIAHSNLECLKQRKSKEVAQTNTFVQIPRQWIQPSAAHGAWIMGRIAAHNISKGFLYTVASRQTSSEHLFEMVSDTGASLSCIHITRTFIIRRYLTSVQILPETQQLIGISGHSLEGKYTETLWGTVRDQKGATRRIGLRVTLVPGPRRHIFSVKIGVDDGLEVFVSHNKQCSLSTQNLMIPFILILPTV